MAKVSIVVPVYNVEKYLDRCIESLVNQTLKDIEIILVDDGSPDNCPQMCDEWAKKDSRINVIHKENGGLSSARNAGIESAKGQYIGYIDSDDYAELNMFEILYNCAKENDVDFVMSDYWRNKQSGEKIKKTLDIREGYYSKSDIENEIYPMLIMRKSVDYGPLLSVWHCLYKTDFIKDNNLYFDEEIKWSEDCIYSAILGYYANSFYYLKNEMLYNYMENPGSITTSYKPQAWEIYCLMNEKLHAFFDEKDDFDFSNQLKIHMLYFAFSVFGQLKYSQLSWINKYKVIKKIISSKKLKNALYDLDVSSLHISRNFKISIRFAKLNLAVPLTLIF